MFPCNKKTVFIMKDERYKTLFWTTNVIQTVTDISLFRLLSIEMDNRIHAHWSPINQWTAIHSFIEMDSRIQHILQFYSTLNQTMTERVRNRFYFEKSLIQKPICQKYKNYLYLKLVFHWLSILIADFLY